MHGVDFGPVASERLGLVAVLVLSGLGLLAGIGSQTRYSGSWWFTVATARNARELPPSRLPRLPRGIFFGLLFSAIPLLKGWCSTFLTDHAYFIVAYVCCVVSTAAWLLIVSFIQPSSDQDAFPLWLKRWNWANVVAFLLLMASVVKSFVALSGST
jgi:hypothetical protein